MAFKLIFVLAIFAVFAVDALRMNHCGGLVQTTANINIRRKSNGRADVTLQNGNYRVNQNVPNSGNWVATFGRLRLPISGGCNGLARLVRGVRCPLRKGNRVNVGRQTLATNVPASVFNGNFRVTLKAGGRTIACLTR